MSLAIINAGGLKPSIRIAQEVSEFGAALDDKHRRVFKTWQTHSPPTESDVIRLTEEVNRDGSRIHGRSWKPWGTRLVRLLDQIQVLVRAGDILVSGSQNMIASGVWATVRVSLEIATGYLSYFDKVSLLLMKLGHSSAIQRDRAMLFPNSIDLKEFMCEYLIIVVKLCKTIVVFESKHFLSQLTSSITLDKRFKEFETDMGVWSKIINEKLAFLNSESQLEAKTAIGSLNNQLSFWSESRKNKAEDRRLQVLYRLSPYQDEFERIWRRERRKGSVKWILEDKKYRQWKDCSTSASLSIFGSLGSGKTVAMANIAGEFRSQNAVQHDNNKISAVALFFCQFRNQKTLQPHVILGSIAHQFIRSLALTADHPAIQTVHGDFDANDCNSIIQYMETALPKQNPYYIILDAIDEVDVDNAHDILQSLQKLQNTLPLHLCCSVRQESPIRSMLSTIYVSLQYISMSSQLKDEEIESYIQAELDRRSLSRNLDELTRRRIQETLVWGAQGMYLWVVLQIDALFPLYQEAVTSPGDIARILIHLPEDLFYSFEKALARITDRRYGSRIFQLVAAALRPLTKDELRSGLNIEPGSLTWVSHDLPKDATAMIYRCAGGLLEIDEEDDTVHYIHHSALQHVMIPGAPDDIEKYNEDGEDEDCIRASQFLEDYLFDVDLHLITGDQDVRGWKRFVSRYRDKMFLFNEHQPNVTMGYICVTALNLDQNDKRITRRTRLVANDDVLDKIAENVGKEGMIYRILATALWRNNRGGRSPAFDMTRIIEDLSRVASSSTSNQAMQFVRYAQAEWLRHTCYPCAEAEIEVNVHKLFLRILRQNAAGVTFPWDADRTGIDRAILWARDNGHFRLLLALLADATGSECASIMECLQEASTPCVSRLAYNGRSLGNVLCRYIDLRFSDDEGIGRLLQLGASPNAAYTETSGKRTTPLPLALAKMIEQKSYHEDVVKTLVDGGADAGGDQFDNNPLKMVIQADWAAGYRLLVLFGAQIPGLSPVHAAILCDGETETILKNAPRISPQESESIFKAHSWPVIRGSGNANTLLDNSQWQAEEDYIWVNDDMSQVATRHPPNLKILRTLLSTRSNVNITAPNGMTPLGLATEMSNYAVVCWLLTAGANADTLYRDSRDSAYSQPRRPLVTAINQDRPDIARAMVAFGASTQDRQMRDYACYLDVLLADVKEDED